MSEKSNELIIDPQLLAQIQAACKRRAAELEAASSATAQSTAPPTSPSNSLVGALEQAQLFAAAIDQMPPRIRAFFEREAPAPARRRESVEERAERERLTDLGGWAGC
jgi:hypothetical protein